MIDFNRIVSLKMFNLLALFCHFPMWYPGSGVVLDLSIPDLCHLSYLRTGLDSILDFCHIFPIAFIRACNNRKFKNF